MTEPNEKLVARDVSGNLLICTGCHSSHILEALRAQRPGTISCCPERKMVTVDELLRLAALPPATDEAKPSEAVRERVARGLYEHWIAENLEDDWAGWERLGDKATWFSRADAVIAAMRSSDGEP